MKVKSLELVNIKSYKRQKIELSPTINIITGINNSGKSTIISALANLQYTPFSHRDKRVNTSYGKIFIEVIDANNRANLNNPAFFNGEHSYTICYNIKEKNSGEEYYYYPTCLKHRRDENDNLHFDVQNVEKAFLPFQRFHWNEIKGIYIYPFLANRSTRHHTTNNVGEDGTFSVSGNLDQIAPKISRLCNSSHPQHQNFIKYCDDILGFNIGVIPAENSEIEVGMYVNSIDRIPISSMGDGVINILGFITNLLTENNKLFLIEELENDIHPNALKKLLDLILEKSKENQFVISTHSNIVLKYLGNEKDSKIFYTNWVKKEENSIDSVPTSFVEEVNNTPEERIDILYKLGYEFYDFDLYDAYLLLEESSAERIIRDFLIPHFVPELYQKLKTIGAKGVDDLKARAIDFNRLFVFIHTNPVYFKKAWIIADGDDAGRKCIEKIKKDFSLWPEEHFINFSQKAFEYYYPNRFQDKVKDVLSIENTQLKIKNKKDLLLEVMDWASKNPEEAKNEFSTSAKEIITTLNSISASISNKS